MKAIRYFRDAGAALVVVTLVIIYCACEAVANRIWVARGRPAPRREIVHRGCTRKYPADFTPDTGR